MTLRDVTQVLDREHPGHHERSSRSFDIFIVGRRQAARCCGPRCGRCEAESELVEVGLQVLWLHRAGMRAEQPALQERRRPVTALQGVDLARSVWSGRQPGEAVRRGFGCCSWRARRSRPGCPTRSGCRRRISTCLHRCSRRGRDAPGRRPPRPPEPAPCGVSPFPRRGPRRSGERAERLPIGTHQRRSELVQPTARRLVGALFNVGA